MRVCSTFYFSAHQVVVLHSLESLFTRVHLHLFFNLALYPELVGSKRLRKYYQLEIQLECLVDFAQFLIQFASHFTFLHSKLVLHSFESLFSRINIILFIFIWSCIFTWQDLKGLIDILPARSTACILCGICPIFITAYYTFYFSVFQVVVLHSLDVYKYYTI